MQRRADRLMPQITDEATLNSTSSVHQSVCCPPVSFISRLKTPYCCSHAGIFHMSSLGFSQKPLSIFFPFLLRKELHFASLKQKTSQGAVAIKSKKKKKFMRFFFILLTDWGDSNNQGQFCGLGKISGGAPCF